MRSRSERAAGRPRSAPPGARAFVAGAVAGSIVTSVLGRGLATHTARQRALAKTRHAWRAALRRGRTTILLGLGRARGELHRLSTREAEQLDDAGLAHKVESVLFRDRAVPKRAISINAENGTVFLRGQVDTAAVVHDVGEAVVRIPGVQRVVNRLHLPGTDAPHPPTTATAA